jgi:hypothetical protein
MSVATIIYCATCRKNGLNELQLLYNYKRTSAFLKRMEGI